MRSYTEGRLDRYRIDTPLELSEIRTQPWLSEGSLPAIHVTTGDTSFNCAPTQFHHQCHCFHIMNDMLGCYLWASNHQPFDYWRTLHVCYVTSQPRTSDCLLSHWRALCLLAHDNWRCSIQLEIFTHQNLPELGFDLGSTAGESSVLTARLHMLYLIIYFLVFFLLRKKLLYVVTRDVCLAVRRL